MEITYSSDIHSAKTRKGEKKFKIYYERKTSIITRNCISKH